MISNSYTNIRKSVKTVFQMYVGYADFLMLVYELISQIPQIRKLAFFFSPISTSKIFRTFLFSGCMTMG